MGNVKPNWFDDYYEWVRYVNKYMMNAERQEGIHNIIIKNGDGQTIACWQNDVSGVVYESRSKERLEEDLDKLK